MYDIYDMIFPHDAADAPEGDDTPTAPVVLPPAATPPPLPPSAETPMTTPSPSNQRRLFQNSFNRSEWVENPLDVKICRSFTPYDAAVRVRAFYPLSVRFIRHDRTYNIAEGTVLPFARLRHDPSIYPVQVVFFRTGDPRLDFTHDKHATCRVVSYCADEVELLPPVPLAELAAVATPPPA